MMEEQLCSLVYFQVAQFFLSFYLSHLHFASATKKKPKNMFVWMLGKDHWIKWTEASLYMNSPEYVIYRGNEDANVLKINIIQVGFLYKTFHVAIPTLFTQFHVNLFPINTLLL